MKTIILPLVIFLGIMSCEEENPQPADHFAGSWHFEDPTTPIEISFDVVKEGRVYNYYNRQVNHPAIPEAQRTNNTMVTYDKFEGGYGRIEITSRGYTYYKVTLIYNRFTENGMAVYDIQIDIPSEPLIVLSDRMFIKR